MTRLAANAASAFAWSRTKVLEPTWNIFCMGRLADKGRERGSRGFFRREISRGDQKLLELIYALLTTSCSGYGTEWPQPIESWISAVNRFCAVQLLIF